MEYERRRWPLPLLIILIIIILVAGAGYYIIKSLDYKNSLLPSDKRSQTDAENYISEIGAAKNIINILFLGIDKTEDRESWLGIYRSDTIALARIDLDNKEIKVLSIPRDTYAYLPISGKWEKINHAYAYGSANGNGTQASIDAINNFLGRDAVDYYILMDMEPIPKIVDDIGGVKVDVEIDMKSHGANLSKGLQVLNGKQAFDYIHWRYSPGGDIDRIKRQQKFISALYKQQRDSGKIIETLQIVLRYKNHIQSNFGIRQMIGLAKFLSDVPGGNVTYYLIPGRGQNIGGVSYWVPDEQKEQMLDEFFN